MLFYKRIFHYSICLVVMAHAVCMNHKYQTYAKYFYQPQRSWAKVMFLQASVILSMWGRGGLPQCMLGYHLPGADPPEQTPQSRHPPGSRPPGSRHPPGADPPGSRHPPPRKQTPAYGQRAAGMHPTGIHSC